MVAHVRNNYLPPVFSVNNGFEKIKPLYPVIDKIYKEYADQNHIPGYAFGIMLDGQLVHSGCGGYIDIANKIPAAVSSMFRIASMTKSFTAMAIVKLRDEGKLKLHDPVYHYIPALKDQHLTLDSPDITIMDLLIHSAGFPQDDPWADRSLDMPREELVALLEKGVHFSNPAGTIYEYSNLTYAMLGLIIDRVSGISYQEYIVKNICKPLNMKAVAWEYSAVPSDVLAHGYNWINDKWQEEPLLHDGIFGAMGGMITSIESFSHYVALHQAAWPPRNDADNGSIKRSSIREMHQPWRFNELNTGYEYSDGRKRIITKAYGYGLRWQRDDEGQTYVGHGGGLPGFGSHWLIMPDHGIGAIFFANRTYAVSGDTISLCVLDTLVKEAKLKPRKLPVSDILKERQQALLTLLPDWKDAESSGIFADNFFLDNSTDSLKAESMRLFTKAGNIIGTGEVIPENQLRGYFLLSGEKIDLKVIFTLSPLNPALIQMCQIEEVRISHSLHVVPRLVRGTTA